MRGFAAVGKGRLGVASGLAAHAIDALAKYALVIRGVDDRVTVETGDVALRHTETSAVRQREARLDGGHFWFGEDRSSSSRASLAPCVAHLAALMLATPATLCCDRLP